MSDARRVSEVVQLDRPRDVTPFSADQIVCFASVKRRKNLLKSNIYKESGAAMGELTYAVVFSQEKTP